MMIMIVVMVRLRAFAPRMINVSAAVSLACFCMSAMYVEMAALTGFS